MDISRDCMCSDGSDAAIILMLGSGGSNALTKGVSKWLVKQGVNVLSLGPDKEEAGYHSFPLERVSPNAGGYRPPDEKCDKRMDGGKCKFIRKYHAVDFIFRKVFNLFVGDFFFSCDIYHIADGMFRHMSGCGYLVS